MANENRTTNRAGSSTLLTLVIVIGALYFARVVFIPFSLAVLLAFLLAPLRAEELMASNSKTPTEEQTRPAKYGASAGELAALCIPARDEADEIAGQMLVQLLNKRGLAAKSMDSEALASESLEQGGRDKPQVVCVTAIPPLGYLHTRYLCRRLRTEYPALRLVGALLTERDVEEIKKRQPPVTADDLASSLKQAVAQILALAPTGTNQTQSLAASAA